MTLEQEQGYRFKTLSESKFGTVKVAAIAMGVKVNSLYRYFNGNQAIGKVMKEKIAEVFGDGGYDYILTGRKAEIHSITRDEKGEIDVDVLQEQEVFKVSGLTAENSVIKARTIAGKDLLITVYKKLEIVKTADPEPASFSRMAEPEFTKEQKPPIPIPIADKQAEILQPPQIFTIRAVATPKQPPSGIEFEKGQEP